MKQVSQIDRQDAFPHRILRQIINPYIPGSVSVDTLDPPVLLGKFTRCLAHLHRVNPDLQGGEFRDEAIDSFRCLLAMDVQEGQIVKLAEDDIMSYQDWLQEVNDGITEAAKMLNDFAPLFCRFGSHEGDGADFGFWREEEISWDDVKSELHVEERAISYFRSVANDEGVLANEHEQALDAAQDYLAEACG